MELFFNYVFAIMQPFTKDGWKVLSLIALFFMFKNYFIWKKDKIVLSFVIFLVYGFVICLFSPNISVAFKDFSDYFIGWLFSFLIGYSITDEKNKTNLLKVYIFVFAFTIFCGYLAYFGIIPEDIGFYHFIEDYGGERRLAVFDWPTIFSARCLFVITILLTLLFYIKNNKFKFVTLLITCLYFIYALSLSGTRTCYFALFLIVIVMSIFFCIKKKVKIYMALLLCSLMIIPCIYVYFFNPTIKNRINRIDIKKDYSITSRIQLYKFALELIKEKPLFGYSPKVGISKHEELGYLNVFHNIYLNIMVDFGIIGFILFILIFYNIFKRLFFLYKQTKSVYYLMLIFAWSSILVADNFDCFLKSAFFSGQCFWITGLILGGTSDKNT